MKIGFIAAAVLAVAASQASAQTQVFNNLPASLPVNVPSQCLQCDQLNSLGQVITGTQGGTLTSFSFVLSSWAKKSDNPLVGGLTSYMTPITFNVYNVGAGNSIGALAYTMTQNVTVNYRPEADPLCANDDAFNYPTCNHGLAQIVTLNPIGFNVAAQWAYSLSFSTGGYGPTPTGYDNPNPNNSLNFGVTTSSPSVGSVDAFAYDGKGNGGFQSYDVNNDGPLGDDGYTLLGEAEVDASPEPASLVLMGTGLAGMAAMVRRRRKA